MPGAQRALRRRYLVRGGVLALVILLGANHGWVRDIRDQFLPKRWGIVEPGKIYRSGQISARLIKPMLAEHNIQRVVDLTFDNPEDNYHEAELAACAELGIDRQLFPLIADGTGDVKTYAAAVAAVAEAERAGIPVLVHCYAGTQRTGGVVATYRLLVQGKSPEFVFAEMKQYKYNPHTSPRLLEYLNEHLGDLARELVRLGTIDSIPDPLPVLQAE
ncbi:MAG: tyrosine-protein phosphatase [Planctomycetales bacterium]